MAENGILDYQGMNQAIYRGATSNIIVDTQSMSIEIGAGNSSHTSNLHIECDHDANVASIKLNSNVVTEFPRSKKLIKYPRVALTAASGESSGYQGYYVTESSNSADTNRHSWKAFDMTFDASTADNAWANDQLTNTYSGTDNAYNGSINLGTGAVNGEWIKLQLPDKIRLEYMKIWLRDIDDTRIPEDWILYGSNDNSNWTPLLYITGQGAKNENQYSVNATSVYDYFAVVVTKISGQTNYFRIVELEYFGLPEYDPDAAGMDVKVTSYPNVPNTDWLEVYYDAKDLADGGVTSVSDLKPSSLGSAINSTSVTDVSVSDGAFVFNGTTSGIDATLSNPQGAWVHSVSVWIKLSKDHSEYNDDNVFCIGSAATSAQLESLRINSNDVRFVTFQSGADEIFPLPMNREQWYHFTLTYDGGASKKSFRLFRNGVESIGTTTATPVALNVAANSLLSIGYERVRNRSHFPGSIANFRIFNRALTTDEIWQLYAYQKEYFGHGDLGMTLKAGRLGIGTSEPRAALDVMGRLYGPGTIPCFSIHTGDYWGTDYSSWGTTTGRHWEVLYRTPLPFIQRTWLEYDTHNVISFMDYPTTTNTGTKTIFTAPMSGFYHFSFNIGFKSNSANDYVGFMLSKNDTEPYNTPASDVNDYFLGVAQQIDVGMSYHVGSSVNIFLKKGETVVPYSRSVNSLYISNGGGFNFSGYFIG